MGQTDKKINGNIQMGKQTIGQMVKSKKKKWKNRQYEKLDNKINKQTNRQRDKPANEQRDKQKNS